MNLGEGPPGSIRSDLQSRLVGDLVNRLMESSLQSPNDLNLLLDMVADLTGFPLPRRYYSGTRPAFVALVRECGQLPAGMMQLAKSVQMAEGDTPQALTVLRLALEWEALDSQPELLSRWDWLRGLHESVEDAHVQQLVRGVGQPLFRLPGYCTTTWSAFLALLNATSTRDTVPPWMLFLDRLSQRLDHEMREELRAQTRQWAQLWGLGGRLDETRYARQEDAPNGGGHIIVQVAPDGLDPDNTFHVSFWVQSHPRAWLPEPGPQRSTDRANLRTEILGAVSAAEEAWGDRDGALQLEFVMPTEFLHWPFEWWPGPGSAVPLAVLYAPIVLRSHERLASRRGQRNWRTRWNELQRASTNPNVRARWGLKPSGGADQQEIALLLDHSTPAIVLTQPPLPDRPGMRDLEMAIRAGYPLIIFNRRADYQRAAFLAVVGDIQEEGLAAVTRRLTHLRREAALADPQQRTRHPCFDVAVLWDDPDRKPWSPAAGGIADDPGV